MNFKDLTIATLLLSATIGCGSTPPVEGEQPTSQPIAPVESAATTVETPTGIEAALQSPDRAPAERERDMYRNPAETLAFFGVTPTSNVVELWSGGGWYTNILAPYLSNGGNLVVTHHSPDAEKEYHRAQAEKMTNYLAKYPSASGVVVTPTQLTFGLDGQADFVLTFRNVHNWVKGGYDAGVYASAFKALKSGGVFGVVEHRGPAGMTREQSATSGYMDEAQVIKDVEAAGFKLAEKSEVNANPKDTKSYEKGVWTLPPSLKLGDVDRAKYTAIGESDRMTLKFVKP